MRRPPAPVVFVARTHGLVGMVALVSIAILRSFTRDLPYIAFGPRTYVIALGIALFYCATAAMIWFGTPFGRFFGRVCGLLYLARPNFGSFVWETMNSAEFQAHFMRNRS